MAGMTTRLAWNLRLTIQKMLMPLFKNRGNHDCAHPGFELAMREDRLCVHVLEEQAAAVIDRTQRLLGGVGGGFGVPVVS